jgi:hypothetical protein
VPTLADPTLRGQLRRAIERAWAAAIASGALPTIRQEKEPTVNV